MQSNLLNITNLTTTCMKTKMYIIIIIVRYLLSDYDKLYIIFWYKKWYVYKGSTFPREKDFSKKLGFPEKVENFMKK